MPTPTDHPVACTISRYKVQCVICLSQINPGDRMFPFLVPTSTNITSDSNQGKEENDVGLKNSLLADPSIAIKNRFCKSKQSLVWGHESCHHPSLPPPPPCRHWERLGRCPAREMGMCAFHHRDRNGDQNADHSNPTPSDKRRWGGKRNFVRNQHKNSVFRIFLMQTYGIDYLRKKNTTIIDAAGGKGELSWELMNLSGVDECVVIDPRPLNLGLCLSKWEKGLYEPKRTGPVFKKWYPACEDGCKFRKPRNPRHLRCFFNSDAFLAFLDEEKISRNGDEKKDSVSTKKVESSWFKDELAKAKLISWTTKGLLQHENGDSFNEENDSRGTLQTPVCNNQNDESLYEIDDEIEAWSILNRCHLIVGFHPDQAAGEIAEFASARGIPWCIVPCCVYSELFPRRRLKKGPHVKSYDHLIEWLCEIDPNAKIASLDLEGKNKVVYTLPYGHKIG